MSGKIEKTKQKQTDQEYGKNTMDSQKAERKILNIQNKNQTLTKSHSKFTVGHTPPKQPFRCAPSTTSKSANGGEVNSKLFI